MLSRLAELAGKSLLATGSILTTAESCTGGWVAKLITDISGSSAWFDRGFVTYTNESKQDMLGVSSATLEKYGAVSEQVVKEMTAGALANSSANIALAISGIAGPGGGSEDKPVGMVCFSWQKKGQVSHEKTKYFTGDRHAVREHAVIYALETMIEILDANN